MWERNPPERSFIRVAGLHTIFNANHYCSLRRYVLGYTLNQTPGVVMTVKRSWVSVLREAFRAPVEVGQSREERWNMIRAVGSGRSSTRYKERVWHFPRKNNG